MTSPSSTSTGASSTPSFPTSGAVQACFTTVPDPPVIDVGQTLELNAGCSENVARSATFQWRLGNGSAASGRTVEIRYDEVGRYRVQLTVAGGGDAAASSDATEKEVEVRPRPKACFHFHQILANEGRESPCTVAFDASCSEGDVSQYQWFFEGSPFPPYPPPDKTVTTDEPTIEYSWAEDRECLVFRPFEKTVRLTVVDERGVTDEKEETVFFGVPMVRPQR